MKRVKLFKDGDDCNGVLIMVPDSYDEFISMASRELGFTVNQLFYEGVRVTNLNVLRDNDILYASSGEHFISPAVANSFENDYSSGTANRVGSPCFADIRYAEIFFDKTLLLETLFSNSEKIFVITAPPRCGKSVNMDMVRKFVEITNDRDVSKSLFADTHIAGKADILLHFHKYPVIHLNLAIMAQDYESTYFALREVVQAAFRAHRYLKSSSELSDDEKKYYSSWLVEQRAEFDKSGIARLETSIFRLSEFLKKHHNQNTIILIDELDAPVMNAMYSVNSEDELTRIAKLRDTILGNVLKNFTGEPTFQLCVLTGVADVNCAVTSPLRNLSRFPFLQKSDFLPYYGVLELELAEKIGNFTEAERRQLEDMYNGYNSDGKKIYNIWSVTKAIPKKDFSRFWIEEVTVIKKFKSLLKNGYFSNAIKNLISRKTVCCKLKLNTIFQPIDLFQVAQCFKDGQHHLLKLDIALLFLYQHGYLTTSAASPGYLEVPNNEICAALELLCYTFFEDCNINFAEIDEAAVHFPKLLHWDEEEFEIRTFRMAIERICKEYSFVFNHQVIHSLLFIILQRTSTKWEVIGMECPVRESYVGSTRCDIVLYWEKMLIIIEIKYKEGAEAGLAQINTNGYLNIINNSKIFGPVQRNEVQYYFAWSISVSEERNVSSTLVIKDAELHTVKKVE